MDGACWAKDRKDSVSRTDRIEILAKTLATNLEMIKTLQHRNRLNVDLLDKISRLLVSHHNDMMNHLGTQR